MKEKIYRICTQLNDGQIAVTEATEQLLDLFAVSGQLPLPDISNREHKELMKKLYPKDNSKRFRR
jgi:hypothetical protein